MTLRPVVVSEGEECTQVKALHHFSFRFRQVCHLVLLCLKCRHYQGPEMMGKEEAPGRGSQTGNCMG